MDLRAAPGAWPPDAAASTVWRRDDRHAFVPAALVALLLLMMIVPEGLDYDRLAHGGPPAAGSLLDRTLWLSVLGLSATLIFRRRALAVALFTRINGFLPLFVALAVASLAWSIDPSLTARRLVRLVTMCAAAVAFVLAGWHPRRLQAVLRPVLTAVLAASALFALAMPSLAVHTESAAELAGAWHGLANHKNGLGALACAALVLWLHASLQREVRWPAALAGGALSLLCLVMSRSSTAAVAAVLGAGFVVIALTAQRTSQTRAAVPALVLLLVAALLLYALGLLGLVPGASTLMASIAALSDKGTTLTGRTEIWGIVSEHSALRPLLGSGYAAYWTAGPVPGTESYEFVRRMGNFYPGSAHNGYLEVLNDLGFVGLGVLLLYIGRHVRQALQLLRLDAAQAVLLLALFFQQAITNLSETHWFSVLSIDFVLMTLATTALARALLEERWRRAFGVPTSQRPR